MSSANIRDIGRTQADSGGEPISAQQDKDHTFNIRQRGLNVDFMTYSVLSLSKNDMYSLLKADVLAQKASEVFATYFKHFSAFQPVTGRVSPTFQPIGDSLPPDLGSFNISLYNDSISSTSSNSANLHIPVQALVMSTIAVALCLSILGFLCIVTIGTYITCRKSFSALPRDIDSIASVLAYISQSERLISHVQGWQWKGWRNIDTNETQLVSLGSFSTTEGEHAWGIEIVPDSGIHENMA
jgi:hypothetical protein